MCRTTFLFPKILQRQAVDFELDRNLKIMPTVGLLALSHESYENRESYRESVMDYSSLP